MAEGIAFDWSNVNRWVPDLLVGWTFIGCGLIVVARRPESRSGLLMVATGFTWFVGNFAAVGTNWMGSLAANGLYLHRGPLIHLILTYPSGRITSRASRAVIGLGYAAAIVPQIWNSEVASLILAGLVVVAGVSEYASTVGRRRRDRRLAAGAAVGFGLVVTGGDVARMAFPAGEVSYPSLLAYQVMLCAIAGALLFRSITESWERADIANLVVELGAAHPGTLRAALVRAVGDPSLEVGYWFADADSFVDSEGRIMSLPELSGKRTVTLVERDDNPVAAIVHDPAVLDDPELLEAVTSAAQLAASHARLQAEVNARVTEVDASRRRALLARDEERRRLERRLHDGAEHRLQELGEMLRPRPVVGAQSTDGRPDRSRRSSAFPDARRFSTTSVKGCIRVSSLSRD